MSESGCQLGVVGFVAAVVFVADVVVVAAAVRLANQTGLLEGLTSRLSRLTN